MDLVLGVDFDCGQWVMMYGLSIDAMQWAWEMGNRQITSLNMAASSFHCQPVHCGTKTLQLVNY